VYLKNIGRVGVDFCCLTQVRDKWQAVVRKVINFLIAQNAGNFLAMWGSVSLSETTVLHGVN
jgi:hypothetical protein